MAPLLVFIVGLKIKEAGARETTYGVLIIGIVSFILYFASFVVAVYTLSRLRTAGGLGVFAPAIVGLLLSGFLLLLLGSNFVLSFHLLESGSTRSSQSFRPKPARAPSIAVA